MYLVCVKFTPNDTTESAAHALLKTAHALLETATTNQLQVSFTTFKLSCSVTDMYYPEWARTWMSLKEERPVVLVLN